MSIESRCTTGAMASKKARSRSPVSAPMAAASFGEVSGPVAMMTLVQPAGGSPSISSRMISISGWAATAAVTCAANPVRSTASAPPAGSLCASAAARISKSRRRISRCSMPMALACGLSARNELEQTSSARSPVRCAGVCRTGRISCSATRRFWRAICHAASAPARPPPITWTGPGVSFEGFSFDIWLI